MWIRTLPYPGHVGGGNKCGGDTLLTVDGYYNTRWLTGLWSTQAKVEGIMLKAAWHWGSDSSVINNVHGKPGHTPLYIGLLSTWGSMYGDQMLSPFSWEGSFGNSDKYN
jgi:hypothetical protein